MIRMNKAIDQEIKINRKNIKLTQEKALEVNLDSSIYGAIAVSYTHLTLPTIYSV